MTETKPNPAEVTVELLSQPRYLSTARAAVMAFTKSLGFDDSCCSHIALAVDEAICNIIRHGYSNKEDQPIWLGLSTLRLDERDAGVQIVIEDRARQVDPTAIKGRNLEDIRPGGLGVHIIREVMEGVSWKPREGGGMCLRMSRRLPSAGGGRGISALPESTAGATSSGSSVGGESNT